MRSLLLDDQVEISKVVDRGGRAARDDHRCGRHLDDRRSPESMAGSQSAVVIDSRRLIAERTAQAHAATFDQRVRGVSGAGGIYLRQRRREREYAGRTAPVGDGLDAAA